MKYLACVIILFTFLNSRTQQSLYGSISVGYQRIIQVSQPPSYIVNTYHQISNPWFWRPEELSFSDAVKTDLSVGHLLTKNIGYEFTGSYFNPLTVLEDDGYTERRFSGQFFTGSFKIVLNVPFKKADLYAKLGVNGAFGKLSYYQRMYNKGELPLSFDEATLKYEYTDGAGWGYNLALGTSFNFHKRWSVFGELYAINQSFEPVKGQRTEQTTDGVDEMQYNDKAYYSQIAFGDVSEWYNYTSADNSQPQKLYKRNYSLGGVGINLGVKCIIWANRKEQKVQH